MAGRGFCERTWAERKPLTAADLYTPLLTALGELTPPRAVPHFSERILSFFHYCYLACVKEIIAVLSRKGGVGKTVTAMHVAALLSSQGKDVAVLDKDPEGSAGAWARAAGDLPFMVYPESREAQALKHAWVVVDTPPNDAKALGSAARMATRVIVVAKCNALEADRLVPTLDALAASGFGGPWGILLTQARGALGKEMQTALEEEELPVLGVIPHLVKFERAFGGLPGDLGEYSAVLSGVLA